MQNFDIFSVVWIVNFTSNNNASIPPHKRVELPNVPPLLDCSPVPAEFSRCQKIWVLDYFRKKFHQRCLSWSWRPFEHMTKIELQ